MISSSVTDWKSPLLSFFTFFAFSLFTGFPIPVNREKAKTGRKESKGDFQSVTDEEIINAYKILAKEGVFCEPASAASVAGLIKNKNRIQKESCIVCVLTGNGLKDPDCAIKSNDAVFRKNIEPSLKNITKILGY